VFTLNDRILGNISYMKIQNIIIHAINRCSHKPQEWLPHTKRGNKLISIYICKQPNKVLTQSFRFLSVGAFKTPKVFSSNKNEVTLHQYNSCGSKVIRNGPWTLDKARKLYDQGRACMHWFNWGKFWAFVVNCDLMITKILHFLVWLLLPTHCSRCTRSQTMTHTHTHTHTHTW
jgi:hypothetical protein